MFELSDDLDRLAGRVARCVVATLVATHGATPRKQGARMLVGERGEILGSVTIGGCVDARVIEESERCLADGASRLVALTLGDEDAWEAGLSCGGTVEVLVEPVAMPPAVDPLCELAASVRDRIASGRPAVICTRLDEGGRGRRRVWFGADEPRGSLGDPDLDARGDVLARDALASGRAQTVALGAARIFVEPVRPPVHLVIVGATHLAMALTEIARAVGLPTIVVDGRPRFATRERFPHATGLRVGMPSEIVEGLTLDSSTAVVLAAHDYKYDLPVLRHVLRTRAGYVGMLGSRRRGDALKQMLREDGFDESSIARVRVPIGLDLGGTAVTEIALAVVAEIVAVVRRASGLPLSDPTDRQELVGG